MGLQSAVYSWSSVKALHGTVFSMNSAGIVAILLAIVWAVKLGRGVGDYVNLVTPGDGHLWTAVIIVAAFCCTPVYILGIKIYVKIEATKGGDLDDLHEDHDINRLLFIHALVCLVSGILVAILNVACLVRSGSFQQKDRDGLIEAIENYGNDVIAKARVDAVQTNLECCGGDDYKDWFHVSWIKTSMDTAEDTKESTQLEGQSESEVQDDESISVEVPFSCCSNDILKPCVHHDILKPSAVYDYDPKRLTIATSGCRSKIIARGRVVERYLIGYLVLLTIYQIILSLLSRLLQTAHSNDMYIGPQKSRYNVWIFTRSSNYNRSEPLLRHDAVTVKNSEVAGQQSMTGAPAIPTSFSDTTDDELPAKNRQRNIGTVKFLRKIRSKLTSANTKSLPLVRSAMTSLSLSKSLSNKETSLNTQYDNLREISLQDQKEETNLKDRVSNEISQNDPLVGSNDLSESPDTVDLLPLPSPPTFSTSHDTFKIPSKVSSKKTLSSEKIRANPSSVRIDESYIGGENRRKVLAKFEKLSEIKDEHPLVRRKQGGAENAREERYVRASLESTDVYDRFRGTLQHTLARRETMRCRSKRGGKSTRRIYSPRICTNVDVRRGNLIARLRCNDVSPSYRLLANFQIPRRIIPQTSPQPPSSPPPPPPSPPPLPPVTINLRVHDSNHVSSIKTLERIRCGVCNRSIRRISKASSGSFAEVDEYPPPTSSTLFPGQIEAHSRKEDV